MARKYDPFGAILGAIKRTFSRSPSHRAALNAAKCPDITGPRGGARYICEICGDNFGIREVQVDHINPVVPVDTPARNMSWDLIIARLFCDISNLQVLCTDCHKKKSAKENAERRKVKKDGQADSKGKSRTSRKRISRKGTKSKSKATKSS